MWNRNNTIQAVEDWIPGCYYASVLSYILHSGFLLICYFPAKFSWFALCVCSVLPVAFSPPLIRLISFTWPSLTCPQLYLINGCFPVFFFLPVFSVMSALSHSQVSLDNFVWILESFCSFFNQSASAFTTAPCRSSFFLRVPRFWCH